MGEGLRGNNGACSALCQLSVTSPTTHKQFGPFWCCFLSGWVCIRSRTLWVSPMNSPVWLGVSPTATTPTGVFNQRFEAFFPQDGSLGCVVCLAPQLFLLVYLHANVRPPSPPAAALPRVLSTWLPISAPPTGLDECFFFNSLVVGLPYSSIFCFKFVVVLLLDV